MTETTPAQAFVTGAAGFIGSHLVDRLLGSGQTVVGLDDFSLGKPANLANALRHPNFTFVEGDATDAAFVHHLLSSRFSGPFDVWHLAANSDIAAGTADPDIDFRKTFLTTYHVAQACRELPVSGFYFASTSAVYGDRDAVLHESTGPLLPISHYGAMKLASEATLSAYAERCEANLCIFRFPNVVGPRSTHGILFDFFRKLEAAPSALEVLGDGTQEKQYLHVDELLDAMLLAHAAPRAKRAVFNVGVADSTTTVRTIAELFKLRIAPDAALCFGTGKRGWIGDVPRFRLDTAAIRGLGWAPKLRSTAAVERALREMREERGL